MKEGVIVNNKYFNIVDDISKEIRKYNINDKEVLNKIIFTHMGELVLDIKCIEKTIEYGLKNDMNILEGVYPFIYENKITSLYPISSNLKDKMIDIINGNSVRDIIGLLYEENISIGKRKDAGQFYTRSNKVIDYVLDEVGYFDDNVIGKRIIDPAVGSGLFLINAVNRIKKFMYTKGYSSIEILKEINSNVYAVDINPFACYVTELNLLIELMDLIFLAYKEDSNFTIPRFNIYNGDFTRVPKVKKQVALFNIDKASNFKEPKELDDIKSLKGKYSNGFDFIVSNPPYITMYGRRSRNMTEEKREYFNRNYDFVINKDGNNKFNSMMFFIERAIKMLKQGQNLCFIVDMSILETAYRDIRKFILETCKIKSLTVNLKEFQNVASGQGIIYLIKEDLKKKRDGNIIKWVDGFKENPLEVIQQKWYAANDEYKYARPLGKYEELIVDKLEKNKILYDYFPKKQLRTCCALTGRSQEFMVNINDFKNDKEDLIFPYLEGSRGLPQRFGKPIPTRYFKYDYDLQQRISEEFKVELERLGVKNKKRIALGDRESYLAPKIFIRQSAKKLIASYTEEKFAANNSIYVLTNKINTHENRRFLKYVCGLLNSNLLTFYARVRSIIRMGNGKTPQIKLADLKRIPICVERDNLYYKVIELVDRLQKDNRNRESFKKLNDHVYRIYNISEGEISFIEDCLENYDI